MLASFQMVNDKAVKHEPISEMETAIKLFRNDFDSSAIDISDSLISFWFIMLSEFGSMNFCCASLAFANAWANVTEANSIMKF